VPHRSGIAASHWNNQAIRPIRHLPDLAGRSWVLLPPEGKERAKDSGDKISCGPNPLGSVAILARSGNTGTDHG